MDSPSEVIKNDTGKLEADWYRSPMSKAELKELVRKWAISAEAETLGYIANCGCFFNGAIIILSAIFELWIFTILTVGAPFYANIWRYLIVAPQHTGLGDNSPNFRECTRTIGLNPMSGFLHRRMQWHVEHHVYAAVPFYNLKVFE